MVLLMYRARTFCQFFFNRDTRKLIAIVVLVASSSGVMLTCPTATARQRTYNEPLTCKYIKFDDIVMLSVGPHASIDIGHYWL